MKYSAIKCSSGQCSAVQCSVQYLAACVEAAFNHARAAALNFMLIIQLLGAGDFVRTELGNGGIVIWKEI